MESTISIFFDLDGTLTDPRDGIVRCLHYALEELGRRSPPEGQLQKYIGPPLYESFAELLDSEETSLVQKAVSLYRSRFADKGIFENALYPGIIEALAALQATRHSLYVVTSKPTVFARRIIDHFGLHRFLQNIYGSEPDGTRADKRELIGHVLAQENIHPIDAVMIGDREHDVKGALANKVRAVGVLWGYGSREELIHVGASALCETPQSLIDYLS